MNKSKVVVDSRIELLSVVQLLGNNGANTEHIYRGNSYTKRAEEYFHRFAEHKLIKMYEEMSKEEFEYDAPISLILSLSEPPELSLSKELDEFLVHRCGGEKKITEFLNQLRKFAYESDFMKFYQENKDFYRNQTEKFDLKKIKDNVDYVTGYFRADKEYTVNIIISLMRCIGNYGVSIKNRDGEEEIHIVLSKSEIVDNEEMARISYDTLWHEISHSFVNPAIDEHIEDFKRYDHLYERFYDAKGGTPYTLWNAVLYEYLVRAAVVRIGTKLYDEKVGEILIKNEKSAGFKNIEIIVEKLKAFEDNPSLYNGFGDFMPEIIGILKKN